MGKYVFIDDSEQMDEKIINLLHDSLRPYVSNLKYQFDKNKVEKILPLPN